MRSMALFFVALVACPANDQKVGVYNTPPSVSITSPLDGSEFDEGTIIDFEAIVSDDADSEAILLLIWSSDLDGELSSGQTASTDGSAVYPTANLSPGNHTITLRVIDSTGDSDQDSIQVGVVDLPDAPELAIIHPATNEAGIEDEAFEFVVEVSDAQDDPEDIELAFTSNLDGLFCEPVADSVGTATCSWPLSAGTHSLEFTAEDREAFVTTATATFVVVPRTEIDDDGDNFSEVQGDCDDNDPNSHPGANEYQDGNDNDCDGDIDEGTSAFDDDGDCYCETAPCMGSVHASCTAINGGDCNDANAFINPLAIEMCDAIDNDCDGTTDENGASGATTYYADIDSDGYGDLNQPVSACSQPGGFVTNSNDCYDANNNARPGNTSYYSSHRGDGSYDYDCNSVEDKQYTGSFSCLWDVLSCSYNAGWSSSAPVCGNSGTYLQGCEFDTSLSWGTLCEYTSSQNLTQACR